MKRMAPRTTEMTADVIFLLDIDNTLLDGDRIVNDLRAHLKSEFGVGCAQRYWAIFDGCVKSSAMWTTWAPCSAIGSTSKRTVSTSSGY